MTASSELCLIWSSFPSFSICTLACSISIVFLASSPILPFSISMAFLVSASKLVFHLRVCNLKLFYSIWFARALCFSRLGLKHLGIGLDLFLLFSLFYLFIFLFQVVNGTFQETQVATHRMHFFGKGLHSTRCCDCSSNLIFEFYTNRQQIFFLNLSNLVVDLINPSLMTSKTEKMLWLIWIAQRKCLCLTFWFAGNGVTSTINKLVTVVVRLCISPQGNTCVRECVRQWYFYKFYKDSFW